MKKLLSVILTSVLLALSLTLGAFTFTANALTSGDYTYEVIDDKAVITNFNEQIGGKITIPETLGGYVVAEIGDKAFYECKRISEIIVPASVTAIGDGAFAFCKNLEKITLPDDIEAINYGAFSDCVKLSNVVIPDSVKTIGEMAFAGCENLCNIVIPQGVTSIGAYAFGECESLEKISIPNSVESVGESAFSNCISLSDVFIGSGIDTISKQMFYGCKAITYITIPSNVETINNSAFEGCVNLVSIQLSNRLKTVKSYAFNNCNMLNEVGYSGNSVDRNAILIEQYNGPLTIANWNYGTCEPDEHQYNGDCLLGCSVCHWTPSKHVYDNACDTTCNVCGFTRTPSKHIYDNDCDTNCNVCGAKRTITHSYKTTTTKATTSKNGKVVKKCSVCDKVASTTTIKYAKTFKLSATSYTYNGKNKTPTVTVKDSAGTKLKKNVDYTLSVASSRKNVGTYKVTVKLIGNYTGTKTLTFKINAAKLGSSKLSATSYTYNGKNKTPTVTVKNSAGTKLKKNVDYTLSVASSRKNVGTYKVTIKGKGNYTGTKTLTFKINPPKTTVSKLTAGTKSITVNITKKSTQVTGYQVQYSTSKSFSSTKTKTISSYKTTKYTLKSLSAKKTYYVRVRTYKTVSGKKYYSGWSTYKYIKTK